MLKPTALKGARWVLRGGSGSNATSLPDQSKVSERLNGYPAVSHSLKWIKSSDKINGH